MMMNRLVDMINIVNPMPNGGILSTALLCTFGIQFMGFVVAATLQTETFYDVLGGMNFLTLAWIGCHNSSDAISQRLWHMTILFVTSRGWLSLFLAWRAHSRKGDARFDGVIQQPLLFLGYWMIQACWIILVSMPLLIIQQQEEQHQTTSLSVFDWILIAGFAFGIVLEISSDITKTRWIESGRNGGFCNVGWWKYSRHANYAGEVLQWWCAAGLCQNWIGLVSPLFTMIVLLLMNGTGIWNAEGQNLKRYYESEYAKEYMEYRRTTSPLIPMMGYGSIPLPIKRWCLFEWERYEYRPSNKKE